MQPTSFYHIYNRGNNQQKIFLKRENYLFFLNKIRNHLLDHLDIIAYCLMPNHFHLLVYSKEEINHPKFSNDLRVMLRSYTRAINKQEGKTGSLFQQHTKIKLLDEESSHTMTQSHSMTRQTAEEYPFICFHYVHQNPIKARLVKKMENWEMSSFQDYSGLRNGTLCNKSIAYDLLDIPNCKELFTTQSYGVKISNISDPNDF